MLVCQKKTGNSPRKSQDGCMKFPLVQHTESLHCIEREESHLDLNKDIRSASVGCAPQKKDRKPSANYFKAMESVMKTLEKKFKAYEAGDYLMMMDAENKSPRSEDFGQNIPSQNIYEDVVEGSEQVQSNVDVLFVDTQDKKGCDDDNYYSSLSNESVLESGYRSTSQQDSSTVQTVLEDILSCNPQIAKLLQPGEPKQGDNDTLNIRNLNETLTFVKENLSSIKNDIGDFKENCWKRLESKVSKSEFLETTGILKSKINQLERRLYTESRAMKMDIGECQERIRPGYCDYLGLRSFPFWPFVAFVGAYSIMYYGNKGL